MANNITVLQALDMISEATKQYVDDVSFSGDFKDLVICLVQLLKLV